MNLDDYEKKYYSVYKAFAEAVRFILEQALLAAKDLPRPHAIQCRAKDMGSVWRRLDEAGKLDTQTLELERRDFAGARLIFFTNNDVDRFLASSLIRDNFEIEEDSTRIFHPTLENKEARYRAIHYTVRLREDRVRLAEYASFAGLRCEIQVQTILNHAWSETSHDILYKNRLGGYGERAMKNITRRFERIMDDYLMPAGYEIQMAQREYERVLRGKDLYERDIATLLDNAQNNNERYEILSGLKDYAIPNYDDLSAAYEGLKAPLLRAVEVARVTKPVPIETTYGKMEGFKPEVITKLVVEIVGNLRYVDAVGTLQLLIDIYRGEADRTAREQIVNTARSLCEYNIDAYRRVGPMLQIDLLDHLSGIGHSELDAVQPIALTVWSEALRLEITGRQWKGDTLTLGTWTMPVSNELMDVRGRAISALLACYDRCTNDEGRREVLAALAAGTRIAVRAKSNDLLSTTLKDATAVARFVTGRSSGTSYELLQHLEQRFLYDYRCAKDLVDDPEDSHHCRTEAAILVNAIVEFRDRINADERFVRYKVLVGFESVYPKQWTEKEFDYQGSNEYRRLEARRYIDEIRVENEDDWYDLIARCAETKSDDMATFPVFNEFLGNLGVHQPEVAERFLSRASDGIVRFLAAFLNGLVISGRPDIYERVLERELDSCRNIIGVVRHLRYSDVRRPGIPARLLDQAIDRADPIAVAECLLLALEHWGTGRITDADTLVYNALTFLNERKDTRWVLWAWSLPSLKFYDELTPERGALMLQNLGYLPEVGFQAEEILARLARNKAEAVWDYFGLRIAREAQRGEDGGRYQAVPFHLHSLQKELSKDPQLAIRVGLSWFTGDQRLFRFRGGLFLSNVFPNCTPAFSAALVDLVRAGGDVEADFALAIIQNYKGGSSIHPVLKEVVSQFPDDAGKLAEVRVALDSAGIVEGDLGFVLALRARKGLLAEWLADERAVVREFAEKHIAEIDVLIASEQRRAEAEREMRDRSHDGADFEPSP